MKRDLEPSWQKDALMSTGAGAAAAAAVAELQRKEEEEMTPYTTKDLAEGWEFKIVRSCCGAFRRPEKLQAVLDEEKRGGWTLVEKFDDCRIRLRRPAGAKVTASEFDDNYDPYRTTVGAFEQSCDDGCPRRRNPGRRRHDDASIPARRAIIG